MKNLLLAALVLPNPALTPGVINPHVNKSMVCVKGYTAGKDVRHVTLKTKKEVFKRYNIPWSDHSKYEVDHFISLELGGANDINNLWPEPYYGEWTARKKDVVETGLHRQICKGQITLKDAQTIIRDWPGCYKQIKSKEVCK